MPNNPSQFGTFHVTHKQLRYIRFVGSDINHHVIICVHVYIIKL